MPLLKPVEPPEHSDETLTAGFVGFAERALTYVGFQLDSPGSKKMPPADTPRVGDYYADYSGLTPEEADATDPVLEDLFKNSKPVSR
jgi:hypothetical protein